MVELVVEFVENAFPLVLLRLPRALTGPELRTLFSGFDRLQKRASEHKTLYFVVVDARELVKLPNPLERKMLTDWMSDPARTATELQYSLGSVVVMTSRPVRAVLTALNWIRRPPKPMDMVETVVEGIDIAFKRFRDANVPVSPAMHALRAQPPGRAEILRR